MTQQTLSIKLLTCNGETVHEVTLNVPLERVSAVDANWVVPLMTAPEVLIWGTRCFLLTKGSADEVGDLEYTECAMMMVPDFADPLAEMPGASKDVQLELFDQATANAAADTDTDTEEPFSQPECVHVYCSQSLVCKEHGCQYPQAGYESNGRPE